MQCLRSSHWVELYMFVTAQSTQVDPPGCVSSYRTICPKESYLGLLCAKMLNGLTLPLLGRKMLVTQRKAFVFVTNSSN